MKNKYKETHLQMYNYGDFRLKIRYRKELAFI